MTRSALSTRAKRGGAHNEDAARADPARGLFVVADGVGGATAGEVASSAAATAAMECMAQWTGGGDPGGVLVEAAGRAHEALRALVAQDAGMQGMGATIVAGLVEGERLFVMNVGDSRAYVIRGSNIIRVTQDHTLVEAMLREGSIDEKTARTHSLRHVLSQALGSGDAPTPSVRQIALRPEDLILMCTDGLTEALRDDEILAIVTKAGREPSAACGALLEAGVREDDCTVLVVEYAL